MNTAYLIAFAMYFSILLVIGYVAYQYSEKTSDFILGSRSINYWVTAISVQASDMSGWLFMAYPGLIYAQGLIKAWVAIGLCIGMFLTWQIIAKKLRVETEKYNSRTLSSYFEHRFGDTSGLIRTVSALFCLLFFTFYISAGFVELGRLFESILNINYHVGICVGAIVVFYTMFGGFVSMAWIDFFQGLFLLAMLLLVPAIGLIKVGGFTAIQLAAEVNNKTLSVLPELSFITIKDILFSALGWGLGYFGMPHVLTKFMGIDDAKNIQRAKYIGMSWQLLALSGAICVGLVGIAYFPLGLDRNELVFIAIVKDIFSPFFAGFILCAVLAAAINVIGAQILSSASILVEDFFKRMGNFSKKQLAWSSRGLVFLICTLACYSAWTTTQSIFNLVKYAWAGLGCTFGPLLLVCLYSKMMNRYAALAGIVCGGMTGALWPHLGIDLDAMIAGYFASLLAMLAVTAITYGFSKTKLS